MRREESGGAVGISTQLTSFFFSPLSSQIEGEAAPDCPLGLMLSRDLSWDLREKMEFSVTAWSSYLGH